MLFFTHLYKLQRLGKVIMKKCRTRFFCCFLVLILLFVSTGIASAQSVCYDRLSESIMRGDNVPASKKNLSSVTSYWAEWEHVEH